MIDGRAQATGIRKPGSDTTMLIVLNAHHDLVTITLPECTNGKAWDLVFDTNVPEQDDRQSFAIGDPYEVTSRSLLLFASQQPEGPIEVGVTGHLVSRPYVRMTLSMLGAQGIAAEESAPDRFVIEPGMPRGPEIPIEVDASGMSYFLVAAAITQTSVRIDGIGAKSAQGDVGLAQALADMGCELEISDDYLILQGRPLHGIQVDMETMPDVVLSLAIAAALAEGETRITNIANLRIKECDRIRAAATCRPPSTRPSWLGASGWNPGW